MGIGGPAHKHSRTFSAVLGERTVEFARNSLEKKMGFQHSMKHQTGKTEWDYSKAYLATTEVFRIHVTQLRASHKE